MRLIQDSSYRKTGGNLPDEYAIVPPVGLQNKFSTLTSCARSSEAGWCEAYKRGIEEENQWLDAVLQLLSKDQLKKDDIISWSSYHAQRMAF